MIRYHVCAAGPDPLPLHSLTGTLFIRRHLCRSECPLQTERSVMLNEVVDFYMPEDLPHDSNRLRVDESYFTVHVKWNSSLFPEQELFPAQVESHVARQFQCSFCGNVLMDTSKPCLHCGSF